MKGKKRNIAGRLGLLTLVLTLVTSSLVAGTYAKYLKQVTAYDEARVARFEFDLKAGGSNFSESESETDAINIFDTLDDESAVKPGEKLIAPGTTGSFDLDVTNKSEVAVEVTFDVTEYSSYAIPLFYTIEGENDQRYSNTLSGGYGDEKEYKTLDDLENMLTETLSYYTGDQKCKYFREINWQWEYESGNDEQDTNLGIASPTYELEIKCTVKQIDSYSNANTSD